MSKGLEFAFPVAPQTTNLYGSGIDTLVYDTSLVFKAALPTYGPFDVSNYEVIQLRAIPVAGFMAPNGAPAANSRPLTISLEFHVADSATGTTTIVCDHYIIAASNQIVSVAVPVSGPILKVTLSSFGSTGVPGFGFTYQLVVIGRRGAAHVSHRSQPTAVASGAPGAGLGVVGYATAVGPGRAVLRIDHSGLGGAVASVDLLQQDGSYQSYAVAVAESAAILNGSSYFEIPPQAARVFAVNRAGGAQNVLGVLSIVPGTY